MNPLEQANEMLDNIEPPPKRSPEKEDSMARAIYDQGAAAAMASALHFGLEQRGSDVLRAKVWETAKKVKEGDLSDIERALVEQFYMLNSMAVHYGLAAGNLSGNNAKLSPQIVDMAVKCSRASRQLATAIADLKAPRKTTFIKNQSIENQQNNMLVAEVEHLKQRLEASEYGQRMDTGAEGIAAPGCAEVEAMAEVDRTQNGRR
ncbi:MULTISPECIES: hypothetical protein [Cyanophyceae]|uniref:Terminase small subunit n=1 Tax=Leptolyngbya subtilissima DQ-A4 TaxID=2933933 RepID=A0ABV0KBX6_9CYAN|nr:hypothetical protein [Nodosilinea sp. FACHB-141]MBD2111720.1 hypothetical protein [Nodosilinea sp. FACHB-141]